MLCPSIIIHFWARRNPYYRFLLLSSAGRAAYPDRDLKEAVIMCGISGFCSFHHNYLDQREAHLHTLVSMRTSIAHRGHDQTGETLYAHAGLSHTRLSIRDLAMGRQPMVRDRGGAPFAIVYNGEIYNADELKTELRAMGSTFETTCDTEVILEGYIRWGEAVAERLNGIFAFAIWDGARERLMLCRDRSGIKPLFYAIQGDELIFGSEIKALFAHPAMTPEIDLESLREVLAIGPARTDGCGVFCGVHEIRMGCLAFYDRDGLREHPYFTLESRPHEDSYEKTVERVGDLLRDAVRRQMVSDVPVCSFLSGGLDSSVITALACESLRGTGTTLGTFSFDFSGNDEYFAANAFQPERDRPYVDELLPHLSVRHTYLTCQERTLPGLLDDAVTAKDLPGMADVDASLLHFCRLVKQENKVALTGECADEIFGGYPWFYRADLLQADGFPWASDMTPRMMLLNDELSRVLDLGGYSRRRCAESLAAMPRLPGEDARRSRQREISWLNLNWFMPTLLTRMDRASMYTGLEARVPFADHRIIEYLWNVPFDMKMRGGVEKSLLRDAMRGLLPDHILWRKKSPYPKTYDPAYTALLRERLTAILADASSPLHAIVDREKAWRFMQSPAQTSRPWFGQLMAGPQLLAYFIQIDTWMRHYHLSV